MYFTSYDVTNWSPAYHWSHDNTAAMFLFLPNDGGTVGGLEFMDRVVMVALRIVVSVVTILVFVWDLLTG